MSVQCFDAAGLGTGRASCLQKALCQQRPKIKNSALGTSKATLERGPTKKKSKIVQKSKKYNILAASNLIPLSP